MEKNTKDDSFDVYEAQGNQVVLEENKVEKNSKKNKKTKKENKLGFSGIMSPNENINENNAEEEEEEKEEKDEKELDEYPSIFPSTVSSGSNTYKSDSGNMKDSNDLFTSSDVFDDGTLQDSGLIVEIPKVSFWKNFEMKLGNLTNDIIYNCVQLNDSIKQNSYNKSGYIQIFNNKFKNEDIKLTKLLSNIPWFSYRKNFQALKKNDKIYTSDSGWGCMLRASQMILAQGLFQISASIKSLSNFSKYILPLFYDNDIELIYVYKTKNIEEAKDEEGSFINIGTEFIYGLEKIAKFKEKNGTKFLTPPYSIRNFIKKQDKYLKNPKGIGKWFSNYDMIELITKISNYLLENKIINYKIFNFHDGTIYLEDIFNECFEIYKEEPSCSFCDLDNIKDDNKKGNDNEKNDFGFEEINDKNKSINKETKNKFIEFNNNKYSLKNKFIIFVSGRHGISELDQDMYDEILNIYDLPCNIGIISGSKSRAFYFIGKCENNLIFLDPHFVQQTLSITQLMANESILSYQPNNVFYMPIQKMSSSFTIGFAIRTIEDFRELLVHFTNEEKYFRLQSRTKAFIPSKRKKPNLFTVKNFHNISLVNPNQDISKMKNAKIDVNYYGNKK